MIVKKIKVTNKYGIHARPATLLVKKASQFRSVLKIKKDEIEINGKSLLGLMTLAASYGTELQLIADGIDEEELISAIVELFEAKFHEDQEDS